MQALRSHSLLPGTICELSSGPARSILFGKKERRETEVQPSPWYDSLLSWDTMEFGINILPDYQGADSILAFKWKQAIFSPLKSLKMCRSSLRQQSHEVIRDDQRNVSSYRGI